MARKITRLVLFFLPLAGWLWAQDPAPSDAKPAEPLFKFSLGIGLGHDVFNETEAYQKIELKPDLGIGEFGIGLSVVLHYRFTAGNLEIRSEDWVVDETRSFWDLYLPIFRYVRYGQKGRPLFVKFGTIDDMTLGNGYIMSDYSNAVFMPGLRLVGLNADLDGALFNLPLFGFETVIGNLAALDVLGGRFYARPLVLFDVPLIKYFQLGATYVADRSPFRYVSAAYAAGTGVSDPASALAQAFGLDFRLPLLSEAPFTFALYGDLVWLHGGRASGQMVGLGGKIIDVFTYNLQARFNGNNFVPVYFDATYDVSRAVKYPLVAVGNVSGYAGWYFSLGAEIANIFTIRVSVDGPFGYIDPVNAENYLNYPHLRGLIRFGKGLVPGLSADLIYDKTKLGRTGDFFADLFNPDGALTSVKVNYELGPAVISLRYDIRYVPDAPGNPWVITSSLESAVVIPF